MEANSCWFFAFVHPKSVRNLHLKAANWRRLGCQQIRENREGGDSRSPRINFHVNPSTSTTAAAASPGFDAAPAVVTRGFVDRAR